MTTSDIKNVEKVMKLAKKYGASQIKIGNIEVVFSELEQTAPGPALKVSKKRIAELAQHAIDQNDFDESKDVLSTLHLEDPKAFEQALIENELASGDDPSEARLEETHNLPVT